MKLIFFKNTADPIGIFSLTCHEKSIQPLRLFNLPIYTKSKYSAEQIKNSDIKIFI